MDIATLLETAVHSAEAVSNTVHHVADVVGNVTSQADVASDCCSSNNYPTPEG